MIAQATSPEQIFGPDKYKAQAEFHRLAKLVHPDTAGLASEVLFKELGRWWKLAQLRIQTGRYGQGRIVLATIKTKHGEYEIQNKLATGDHSQLYHCSWQDQIGVFKVVRNPKDNDLLRNEVVALRKFDSPFMPKLVEGMTYREPGKQRAAMVIQYDASAPAPEEWHSLEAVRKAYPDGVHAADMAWMWRRVLMGLAAAHTAERIHTAVLPSHILIHPKLHGLMLIDWSYSVEPGDSVKAISTAYEKWYPTDIKEGVRTGLDFYMGAKSMIYLLGGDPLTGTIPDRVPRPLRAFFRGCLLSPKQRPQDGVALHKEFDDLLEQIYGRRRFRPFSMPT